MSSPIARSRSLGSSIAKAVARLTGLAGYAAFGAVLYVVWAARAR